MSTVSSIIKTTDADATIAFAKEAFGVDEGAIHRDDAGQIVHAEIWYGDACLMVASDDNSVGADLHPAWLYLVTSDPDALHDRAKAAGAEIVMELHDTDYGSRDFTAKDRDGNVWSFGTYRPAK